MALTDKLTAIGDAIRNKTGKTGTLTLEQMASEVSNISTGLDDDELAQTTASTADVLSGKTFYSGDKEVKTGTILNRSIVGTNSVVGISSYYPTIGTVTGDATQLAPNLDGVNSLNIRVPKGYYDGESYVRDSYSNVANAIELSANKLVKGNTILGVAGTANVEKNYYNMNNLGTPSATRTDNCYSYNLHQHHTTNSWSFHMCNQNTWGYLELTFPNAINTQGYNKLHYSAACTSLEWNSSQVMAFALNGNAFTKQASQAYSIDVSGVDSLKLVLGINFTIQAIGALTIYDMYLE